MGPQPDRSAPRSEQRREAVRAHAHLEGPAMNETVNENASTPSPSGGKHHGFRAEVSQVLDLVIHSLYSHKEIFLRELLSNASDALDRLRFRAITEPDLLEGDSALEIRVTPEPEA